MAELDGQIVGHAAVVPRHLWVADRMLTAGYVEAVAVTPELQGRGVGTLLMAEVDAWIAGRFDLGALATGGHAFYERLGWRRWRGRTWVRTAAGDVRTADDDDAVMVLPTPSLLDVRVGGDLVCPSRSGDAW